MKTLQLDENTKAIIVEVADVFYEMDVEELSETEGMSDRELIAHQKAINKVFTEARSQGYHQYAFMNHEEAEAQGQDIGTTGLYLMIMKR